MISFCIKLPSPMTQLGVQEEHSTSSPNGEELHLTSYPLSFIKVN